MLERSVWAKHWPGRTHIPLKNGFLRAWHAACKKREKHGDFPENRYIYVPARIINDKFVSYTGYGILMKSHTTQLEVLHAVASIIQRRAGQRRMLQDVLDLLEADLQLHRGTIMLRSPDDDELMVEATKTISEVQPRHMRYQMGEGILKQTTLLSYLIQTNTFVSL